MTLKDIRNIGISAHIDSGKTTVTERFLFYTGKVSKMHEVRGRDGVGATMDFMELERQRGITIQSAAISTKWNDKVINIIDTPGHIDFTIEVERALSVLDGAVFVLCGVGGVQCQSYTVDRQMKRYNVPFITFINKLDRNGADVFKVIEEVRNKLGHNSALIYIPIGISASLTGLIDLINRRAVYFEGTCGMKMIYKDVPSNMKEEMEICRKQLIEHLSNVDEEIGELYVQDIDPSTDQLKSAIRRNTITRKFIPVVCGSALKNKGVQCVLDAITDYLPSPNEINNFALDERDEKVEKIKMANDRDENLAYLGLAFKLEAAKFGQLTYMRIYQGSIKRGDIVVNTRTKKKIRISRLGIMNASEFRDIEEAHSGDICAFMGISCKSGDTFTSKDISHLTMESMFVPEPVVSMSIKPTEKKMIDSFSKGISRFVKEDPTFRVNYDLESMETVVSGMGELHLEIYAQRLEREYNAKCILGKPRVAYRETLPEKYKFDYLHKRQTGGRGQYARIIGYFEPLPTELNTTLKFEDKTFGTNLPKKFIPAIHKGFKKACQVGLLSGHKISGLKCVITDGNYHIVDSDDYSFMLAMEFALQESYDETDWVLLEPIMKVEVLIPMEYQNRVSMGLMKRSAIVVNHDADGGYNTLTVEVPLNQMFGYMGELRSLTQGKGEFNMEYRRSSPVTPERQEEIVAENSGFIEKRLKYRID
ncbi:hypothetical protein A3Q56_02762 [Intoshia linei]|uniref:Elongation factor G, mitochondrial n=1 Tax=Intoshia linei TaxID=1819745 RepID=A0A177B7U2_9BILA|nr:hypothetical protein A3Q56_02762 [Intoshia linei]